VVRAPDDCITIDVLPGEISSLALPAFFAVRRIESWNALGCQITADDDPPTPYRTRRRDGGSWLDSSG
jgi:hypothetical protein